MRHIDVIVEHFRAEIYQSHRVVRKSDSKVVLGPLDFCIDAYVACGKEYEGVKYDPVGYRCVVADCALHGTGGYEMLKDCSPEEFLMEN